MVLPSNAFYRCKHTFPIVPTLLLCLFLTAPSGVVSLPAVSYAETLPKDIAPSFKGHLGSYSVRIVVGFYQADAEGIFKLGVTPLCTFSRTLRVVSPLASLSHTPMHPHIHTHAHTRLWTVAKCARFAVPEDSFSSRVEYGAAAVLPAEDAGAVQERRAALCAPVHEAQRRYAQQICVNVMDNSAFVVRVVLPRTVVAPGQVLHGVCDFRGGAVLCQALEVHVADEETVDPAAAYSRKVLRVGRDTHGAQSCTCSCLDLVPFAVELPAHATPEFATKYSLSPSGIAPTSPFFLRACVSPCPLSTVHCPVQRRSSGPWCSASTLSPTPRGRAWSSLRRASSTSRSRSTCLPPSDRAP